MATVKKLTRAVGDYARGFGSEDGKHYRMERQDLGPAIARTAEIRHLQENAKPNPMGRRYVGSVPATVLMTWLKERGFTMHDWAINAGGESNIHGDPKFYQIDKGVKSQFMRYFLSREFSKLHVEHSTTRVGTGNRVFTG